MENELSRKLPRVFLSHSRQDIDFINRVYQDLILCQTYPWRDDVDIRHGQPWLDAIFEGGIPTCDCILVYLTESSIKSPMVKKEIDASLLQKLKDNRIAFLPYVSSANLRSHLRSDIQTLQVPEWNEINYSKVLPRVVAEIWRSYLDRVLVAAINEQKVKRLEAELDLQKLREEDRTSIFTKAEESDFTYIHKELNKAVHLAFQKCRRQKVGEPLILDTFKPSINNLTIIFSYLDEGYHTYNWHYLVSFLQNQLRNSLKIKNDDIFIKFLSHTNIETKLRMFGFVRQAQHLKSVPKSFYPGKPEYIAETRFHLEFTEKIHRFGYWLNVKKLFPPKLSFEFLKVK